MDAKRLRLKHIAVGVMLLRLVGTVLSFFIELAVSDARLRRELELPDGAFVTDTRRDPWVYVDEEGKLFLYGDKMVGVERLYIPSAVNGIKVDRVYVASSKSKSVKEVVLPSTVDHSKSLAALRWESIETLVFASGTKDLSGCYVLHMPALKSIYLPKTIEKIEKSFWEAGDTTIFYEGTKEEWLALGSGAEGLMGMHNVVFDTPLPDWAEK